MTRLSRPLAALVLIASASGCALPHRLDAPSDFASPSRGRSEAERESEAGREVYGELIRRMLAQRQYYAALAHVQEQRRSSGPTDELTLLEADARRSLGEDAAAERLYRDLLRSDFAGPAYHGLGLLYARRDLEQSVQLLRQAVQRRPTDVTARNDLGYALMMSGRYREALPELATAIELDPRSDKARNNLIVLLLASGDEARARHVASEARLGKDALAGLRRQAQSLARSTGARSGNRGGR